MIVLIESGDLLTVKLSAAKVTKDMDCYLTWKDYRISPVVIVNVFHPDKRAARSNGTSSVSICEAPPPELKRVVDFFTIFNCDTVNSTVTVQYEISSEKYILFEGIIGAGERLEYTDLNGFQVFTKAGALKSSQVVGTNNIAVNSLNVVALEADVVNNNSVANSMRDVTGLSFPVIAGETYWFEYIIPYTAAATTTGSRWSISGPSAAMLNYTSEYTLTSTTKTVNGATAYDIPAASNATSLTTGNIATIWGVVKPSVDGTVTARFASEIASSAITAKAGAILRWIRVI